MKFISNKFTASWNWGWRFHWYSDITFKVIFWISWCPRSKHRYLTEDWIQDLPFDTKYPPQIARQTFDFHVLYSLWQSLNPNFFNEFANSSACSVWHAITRPQEPFTGCPMVRYGAGGRSLQIQCSAILRTRWKHVFLDAGFGRLPVADGPARERVCGELRGTRASRVHRRLRHHTVRRFERLRRHWHLYLLIRLVNFRV